MSDAPHILDRVYQVVRERQAAGDPGSYVASLTARGLPKIRSKVLEEAGEVLEASVHREHGGAEAALVHEVADLLFHTLVLMGAHDLPPASVWAELERRSGVGGMAEKAARNQGNQGEGT